MRRLSREEIKELKKRLAEWQKPQNMAAIIDDVMESLGSSTLFNQGGLAFLRDAWIASEFGGLRQAEWVRLVDDAWPDFELRIDGKKEAYEATEVDDPTRRRGDEYRDNLGEIVDGPVEDWIAAAEQAANWIAAACQKKADKRYVGRANLVVYLNLSEYGIRQKEVEACFPSATQVVKDDFEAVWVLWKKRTYLVWCNG